MNPTKSEDELREAILGFYAFCQERDLEDVKDEYLGIVNKRNELFINRLYMGTEKLLHYIKFTTNQEGEK